MYQLHILKLALQVATVKKKHKNYLVYNIQD